MQSLLRRARLISPGACLALLVLWAVSLCAHITYVTTSFQISLGLGRIYLTVFDAPAADQRAFVARYWAGGGLSIRSGYFDTFWGESALDRASAIGLTWPMRSSQGPFQIGSVTMALHGFSLPIWIPALMALLLGVFAWLLRRRARPGHCRECRYDLTANQSGRCPECGLPTGAG